MLEPCTWMPLSLIPSFTTPESPTRTYESRANPRLRVLRQRPHLLLIHFDPQPHTRENWHLPVFHIPDFWVLDVRGNVLPRAIIMYPQPHLLYRKVRRRRVDLETRRFPQPTLPVSSVILTKSQRGGRRKYSILPMMSELQWQCAISTIPKGCVRNPARKPYQFDLPDDDN